MFTMFTVTGRPFDRLRTGKSHKSRSRRARALTRERARAMEHNNEEKEPASNRSNQSKQTNSYIERENERPMLIIVEALGPPTLQTVLPI